MSGPLKMSIAAETLGAWAADGNKLLFLLEYLQFPQDVIEGIVNYGEFDVEESAEAVAFVSDAEWEELINNVQVDGRPLKLGQKSRTRRLLFGARLMSGGVEELDGQPAGETQAETNHHSRRTGS